MPFTYHQRTRRRIIPVVKTGTIDLGWFRSFLPTPLPPHWAAAHGPVKTYTNTVNWSEAEITMDTIHPGPPYRQGGMFKNLKIGERIPYGEIHGVGTYVNVPNTQRYEGGFMPPRNSEWGVEFDFNSALLNMHEFSVYFPSMEGHGDAAWQKAKPKLETVSGGVALAEARDIPSMLKTTASGFSKSWKQVGGGLVGWKQTPKRAADHFINQAFGWTPFISDLGKLDNLIRNAPDILDRMSDKNGRSIRRRVTLEKSTVETVLASGPIGSNIPFPNTSFTSGNYFVSEPTWQLSEVVDTHIFAVGKFKYYRPEFDRSKSDYSSAWNSARRHATAAGLRVNPTVLYNATPWTWAIDWFANIGDHIDHLTDIAVDSISAEYFYVMKHLKRTRKIIKILPFRDVSLVLQYSRFIETKQRQEGLGPNGFSLTWSQMTPRQLAIAGALGISRSKVAR